MSLDDRESRISLGKNRSDNTASIGLLSLKEITWFVISERSSGQALSRDGTSWPYVDVNDEDTVGAAP